MRIAILFALLFTVCSIAQEPSLFDRWDKNKDGKLAKNELPAPAQRNFEKADKDGDGFISRSEDKAFRSRGSGKNRRRPAGQKLPAGIKKLANLDYAGNDNPKQKLDLYLPDPASKTDNKALPVICWIHGGGWKNGDKANASRVIPLLADGKFAAASIGYRLSHESQWPGQIHDCKAAIRFLKANAEKYNLDPDRIAVWGSSAGGHLVAMLGVTNDVKHLEGTIGPHTDQNSKVACVVDFFGPTELLTMNQQVSTLDHDAPDSPESKLIGAPIQQAKDKARDASPIHHVTSDDAPILIVHGRKDPLVPHQQSVEFEKALEKAGVTTILISIENAGHGKGFPPKVIDIVRKFLDARFFKGSSPEDQSIPGL